MYEFLRDPVVSRFLVIIHAFGEVESRSHGLANQVYNIPGYGGGEHHCLSGDLLWVGKVFLNLVDFFGETVIQ
jgi:hypothetical protein